MAVALDEVEPGASADRIGTSVTADGVIARLAEHLVLAAGPAEDIVAVAAAKDVVAVAPGDRVVAGTAVSGDRRDVRARAVGGEAVVAVAEHDDDACGGQPGWPEEAEDPRRCRGGLTPGTGRDARAVVHPQRVGVAAGEDDRIGLAGPRGDRQHAPAQRGRRSTGGLRERGERREDHQRDEPRRQRAGPAARPSHR